MDELSKAQKARNAIAAYKTLADSLILRGSYEPSGTTGRKLEDALMLFSPEIYGSMGDPRIVELKGLEYVIDRLPRGIEKCTKIVMTAQEDLEGTSFDAVRALKRRRVSYIVSDKEICFVITRGTTEIYDLLTHLTFLNIEGRKIQDQICGHDGKICEEWRELEKIVKSTREPSGAALDRALWNLSIVLGRTYKETKRTYDYLETNRSEGFNSGLFRIIYALGKRMIDEEMETGDRLDINFTPSLQENLGHHRYGSAWARSIKSRLIELKLHDRPVHVVSANLHSFRNIIYGRGATASQGKAPSEDLYEMIHQLRENDIDVDDYAGKYGFFAHGDESGANIDAQIIDLSRVIPECVHQAVRFDFAFVAEKKPVILVMDYAFGAQAFEVMDELLSPDQIEELDISLHIESISIMGKAGILPGKKGDIMLATAHVMEGTPHNYIFDNDLTAEDFNGSVDVFSGPMVTVLGTSLQNRDVLERFQTSSWKAIGLEMEGGHYQRAINAAIIQGHISKRMKVRYAYYASDNPLISGQTLASGPMGSEGVLSTYLITRVFLEKMIRDTDGV